MIPQEGGGGGRKKDPSTDKRRENRQEVKEARGKREKKGDGRSDGGNLLRSEVRRRDAK